MTSDYAFASRFTAEEIPKYELSKQGMPANIAAQLIAEERMLDKTPVSATARYELSSPSRFSSCSSFTTPFLPRIQ